jgi:hypothetical protein
VQGIRNARRSLISPPGAKVRGRPILREGLIWNVPRRPIKKLDVEEESTYNYAIN